MSMIHSHCMASVSTSQSLLSSQGPIPRRPDPVATSTPRGLGSEGQEDHLNTSADGTEKDINTRPSSASSDLTQISTTDISSHGDREDGEEEEEGDINPNNISETNQRSQRYISSEASSGSGQLHEQVAKLSDVEVSLEGVAHVTHSKSDSDSPPPVPTSPLPDLDDRGKGLLPIMVLSVPSK